MRLHRGRHTKIQLQLIIKLYWCIWILKLIKQHSIITWLHIQTFWKIEKIKTVYEIHLPFGKLLATHLFSFALFICSIVVPCFLQKNLQKISYCLLYKYKFLIEMILLKDAADAKKICINWGSQFLTAMFTITFKTTFIIKKNV